MTEYKVDFSYSVPEWGDVVLTADNEYEASKQAMEHINELYPEAIDIEIDGVTAIG